MAHLDRLSGALAEVEAPLGRAIKETIRWTEWLDDELQLTYSFCGLATAALQRYLEDEIAVATKRLRNDVFVSDLGTREDDVESHVVLETECGIVIDPTYTQFYKFVGLSSHLAQRHSQVRALLPDKKIATFDRDRFVTFSQNIATHALTIRDTLQPQLSNLEQELEETLGKPLFQSETERALRCTDNQVIQNIYMRIWEMPSYRPYSIESQAARTPDLDAIVKEVLGKLA